MKEKVKDIFRKLVSDKKKLMVVVSILLLVIIFIIVGISLFYHNEYFGVIKNPDGKKIENEYESLNGEESEVGKTYPDVNISSNNVFEYSNVNEVIDLFNNRGNAVLYMGYSTCIYCRSAIQVLHDTAKDMKIDKIYYLDIDKLSDSNNKELMDVLDDEFITEEGEIYVPLVLFVADGSVVSYNKGTLFSQYDPYKELNSDQKRGLAEIYKYGIQDVINAMNNNINNNVSS